MTQHTGIVTAVSGSYVYTVEGNAGSPSAVRSCKYPLNYSAIKGYGRPDWSLVPADDDKEEEETVARYNKISDMPSPPLSRWWTAASLAALAS